MNDIAVEPDTHLIRENFNKFATSSKKEGFTSTVEIKQFEQEIIVVKTYKNSNELTSTRIVRGRIIQQ